MTPMHANEVAVDDAFVRRMLSERFPRWAGERLERVRSAGTDNALFRLGDELLLRLPRIASAELPIEKEHLWLPRLAPSVPLAIPEPVALGEPVAGYPWRWSVYRWIHGEALDRAAVTDPAELGAALGGFVHALEAVDATGGPGPGDHNAWRGCSLAERDEEMRGALQACRDVTDLDTAPIVEAWDDALCEPGFDARPVWIHGDLIPTNLLVDGGTLGAVIDFGLLGVGDVACDAMAAWTTIPRAGRAAFRETLEVDEATWARGRGWALSWAAIALPCYLETNARIARLARRTIVAVLGDRAR